MKVNRKWVLGIIRLNLVRGGLPRFLNSLSHIRIVESDITTPDQRQYRIEMHFLHGLRKALPLVFRHSATCAENSIASAIVSDQNFPDSHD